MLHLVLLLLPNLPLPLLPLRLLLLGALGVVWVLAGGHPCL